MTKPLGYYCDFRPEDSSYISDLERDYGSFLQHMEYRVMLDLAIGVHAALIDHELGKIGSKISYSKTTLYKE
ncbi:MAG: hypothetical protein ACYTXE_45030, partial [Nostoc sp.]